MYAMGAASLLACTPSVDKPDLMMEFPDASTGASELPSPLALEDIYGVYDPTDDVVVAIPFPYVTIRGFATGSEQVFLNSSFANTETTSVAFNDTFCMDIARQSFGTFEVELFGKNSLGQTDPVAFEVQFYDPDEPGAPPFPQGSQSDIVKCNGISPNSTGDPRTCQGFDCSCPDDGYEPNDNTAGAVTLPANQVVQELEICPSNEDYYVIPVPNGGNIQVGLTFTHYDDGDLDMVLLDKNGSAVASSTTTDNNESLYYEATSAPQFGNYTLRVYAKNGGFNDYALFYQLQ